MYNTDVPHDHDDIIDDDSEYLMPLATRVYEHTRRVHVTSAQLS